MYAVCVGLNAESIELPIIFYLWKGYSLDYRIPSINKAKQDYWKSRSSSLLLGWLNNRERIMCELNIASHAGLINVFDDNWYADQIISSYTHTANTIH
jgi:hypothetical protein